VGSWESLFTVPAWSYLLSGLFQIEAKVTLV